MQVRVASRPRPVVVALLIVIALLAACGGSGDKPAATSAPAVAAELTAVPAATQAPAPTTAPEPTTESKPIAAPTAKPAPTATPQPTSTPEPTAVPEAPTGQAALDLFNEIAKAQAEQKTMRANMTSEKSGVVTEMVIELVRPDRMASRGSAGGDIIFVPEGTYMRQPGGEWTKVPFDMSAAITEMMSQTTAEDLLQYLNIDSLRAAGAGIVDGKPCWVYEYETTIDVVNITVQTQAKIWVGIADKLPYKTVSVTHSSDDPAGVTTTATILYEYGLDLKIEAPIK